MCVHGRIHKKLCLTFLLRCVDAVKASVCLKTFKPAGGCVNKNHYMLFAAPLNLKVL